MCNAQQQRLNSLTLTCALVCCNIYDNITCPPLTLHVALYLTVIKKKTTDGSLHKTAQSCIYTTETRFYFFLCFMHPCLSPPTSFHSHFLAPHYISTTTVSDTQHHLLPAAPAPARVERQNFCASVKVSALLLPFYANGCFTCCALCCFWDSSPTPSSITHHACKSRHPHLGHTHHRLRLQIHSYHSPSAKHCSH